MKELNYKHLREALDALPEYAPPAAVWEALDEALELESVLVKNIDRLPVYAPPSEIWTQIEAALPQAAIANSRKSSDAIAGGNRAGHRRLLAPAVWRYAAALALLLTAWWFFGPNTQTETPTIVTTQESVDEQLLGANAEGEDEAFQLVQELCRTQTPVCEQPEFKTLKTELEELTDAKTELREALGSYGDDPELHAQLARIERERSELLRQMMSMI